MQDNMPQYPEISESEKIKQVNLIIRDLLESLGIPLKLPTIFTLEQIPSVIKILYAAREESERDTKKYDEALKQLKAIVPIDPFYRAEINPQFPNPGDYIPHFDPSEPSIRRRKSRKTM